MRAGFLWADSGHDLALYSDRLGDLGALSQRDLMSNATRGAALAA
jgi:hypothetical protein